MAPKGKKKVFKQFDRNNVEIIERKIKEKEVHTKVKNSQRNEGNPICENASDTIDKANDENRKMLNNTYLEKNFNYDMENQHMQKLSCEPSTTSELDASISESVSENVPRAEALDVPHGKSCGSFPIQEVSKHDDGLQRQSNSPTELTVYGQTSYGANLQDSRRSNELGGDKSRADVLQHQSNSPTELTVYSQTNSLPSYDDNLHNSRRSNEFGGDKSRADDHFSKNRNAHSERSRSHKDDWRKGNSGSIPSRDPTELTYSNSAKNRYAQDQRSRYPNDDFKKGNATNNYHRGSYNKNNQRDYSKKDVFRKDIISRPQNIKHEGISGDSCNRHTAHKGFSNKEPSDWEDAEKSSFTQDTSIITSPRWNQDDVVDHAGNVSKPNKFHQKDTRRSDSFFSDQREKSYSSRFSDGSRQVLPDDLGDEEYQNFLTERNTLGNSSFDKVKEIEQNLFEMSEEYSLGHCVAEDMRMGSGIAVTFKKTFGRLPQLLSQKQKPGGLAILDQDSAIGTRYIYYLVTKRLSTDKPTYENFWYSLKKMRDHIRDYGVKKLAIPKIGCGLDRLDWSIVKDMVIFLFKDIDVEVVVCNFQQGEDSTPQKDNTCKVVFDDGPVAKIDLGTIIIYFSTVEGDVGEDALELSKSFNFMPEFKQAEKRLGDAIRYFNKNKYYILYGCVVRNTRKSDFDFKSFAKCLSQIKKDNKKDNFFYVAYQTITDENDSNINNKIITLLRNLLRDVDVYVCQNNKTVDINVDE